MSAIAENPATVQQGDQVTASLPDRFMVTGFKYDRDATRIAVVRAINPDTGRTRGAEWQIPASLLSVA